MKKIDRNILKQITAQSLTNQSQGVKGLMHSIHKDPKLRDWVTLESVPFAPIPVKKGEQWHLLTLLATPRNNEPDNRVFNCPWALIEWVLPQGKLAQFQDLRTHPCINKLKLDYQDGIKNRPCDRQIVNDPINKSTRQNALYQLLDQLNSHSNEDLTSLAPHYSALLPREIYQFYRYLIAECQSWLNPDVPALILDTAPESQTLSEQTNESAIAQKPEPESTQEIEAVETKKSSVNKNDKEFHIKPNLPSSDLTGELKPWLSQLQNIADSFSIASISKQLHSYEHRLAQPGFKLAIVGEFSRGKSSLINQLLGEKILPVGNLPTTSTLVSIKAQPENNMKVYLHNQPVETRELNEQSWLDLLATDPTGNNQEVLANVQVNLNNAWLEQLDVELIDTPGAGDLSTQRSALVFDLLSQCDAAVLVISATMALSLTETAFLEEQIIGRHVPRILVVVTKLDLVKPEEKATVLDHISDRLEKISPQIPMVSLHPVDENQSAQDAIALIKQEVAKLVAQGERSRWRSYQIANQLNDYTYQLKDIAQKAIDTMQLNQEKRAKEIQKQEAQIQSTGTYWQQIELDLDKRRIKRYQDLDRKINEVQNNVLETLQFQLKKITNPKSWWQDDVPFILRKELVNFSRNIENYLLQKIAEDYSWLEAQVQQHFQQQINKGSTIHLTSTNQDNLDVIIPNLEDLSLSDLQKYRLMTRLGSSAAVIVGYALGGPIGIIGSTGVWMLGENIMNKTIEQQKALIEEELEQKLNQCFREYSRKVSDRLQTIYEQLIRSVQQTHQNWQQNQQALINKMNCEDWQVDQEKLLKSIDELETLENNISSKLKNGFSVQ